jgi:DNA repair protein RadC
MSSKDKPRPKTREKLRRFGVANLSNAELLALVLGSGTVNLSVIQLANAILKTYPLELLHQQTLPKLTALNGLGLAKAAQIMAAVELGRRNFQPPHEIIKNPSSVLPHVSALRRLQREHTVCLYLNARHELLHQETVAVGGLNYSLLEPRDIFSPALRLPAASLIMVHNHPSGSTEASKEDLAVTRKLVAVGKMLGVTLLDHLIVTQNNYVSLREKGLIE